MEVFLVYLWLKLDTVLALLFCSGALMCLSPIVYAIGRDCVHGYEREQHIKEKWPTYKRAFTIGCVFLSLCVVVPSSRDTAILVGTSYAVDLAKSPEGAKVASLIRKKANEYLDEALAEGKKEATK